MRLKDSVSVKVLHAILLVKNSLEGAACQKDMLQVGPTRMTALQFIRRRKKLYST